jgi:hypothetical protein
VRALPRLNCLTRGIAPAANDMRMSQSVATASTAAHI